LPDYLVGKEKSESVPIHVGLVIESKIKTVAVLSQCWSIDDVGHWALLPSLREVEFGN